MSVKLLFNDLPTFLDSSGNPATGYKLHFFAAGSTTYQNTYQDSGGLSAHANPIVLNARGQPPAAVWGTVGLTYKMILASPTDSSPPVTSIETVDNIAGINDASVTIDQWVGSGLTPTYVSAVSFTLSGDQTTAFHPGRRLKTTNSGGSIYSTIISSAFGALTTVTVVNDSGVLDSGLSAVSYGLLTATNPSTPLLTDAYPIVSGSSDKTKKVRFEVDGLTTATTRVLTVPDADIQLANWSTGDVKITLKTVADSGWVLMNDGTIGSAASGATTRANADTVDLYTLLWTNTIDANCAVSTGRGASAAADFAANKTIALPKTLGRSLATFGTGAGLTARTLAQVFGEEGHALTSAENGPHIHASGANTVAGKDPAGGVSTLVYTSAGTPFDTGSSGSGTAHNTMQPTLFLNVMVKL